MVASYFLEAVGGHAGHLCQTDRLPYSWPAVPVARPWRQFSRALGWRSSMMSATAPLSSPRRQACSLGIIPPPATPDFSSVLARRWSRRGITHTPPSTTPADVGQEHRPLGLRAAGQFPGHGERFAWVLCAVESVDAQRRNHRDVADIQQGVDGAGV